MPSVEQWLLLLIVVPSVLVGLGMMGALVIMALERYGETPKTAIVYALCVAVLYLAFILLGATWLDATGPALMLGILLGMFMVDRLGIQDDE